MLNTLYESCFHDFDIHEKLIHKSMRILRGLRIGALEREKKREIDGEEDNSDECNSKHREERL